MGELPDSTSQGTYVRPSFERGLIIKCFEEVFSIVGITIKKKEDLYKPGQGQDLQKLVSLLLKLNSQAYLGTW